MKKYWYFLFFHMEQSLNNSQQDKQKGGRSQPVKTDPTAMMQSRQKFLKQRGTFSSTNQLACVTTGCF